MEPRAGGRKRGRVLPCLAVLGLLSAFLFPAAAARSEEPRIEELRKRVQRQLDEVIVPFWYPRAIDRTHGGYTVGFDAPRRKRQSEAKGIVAQARLLYFFSRLSRAGGQCRAISPTDARAAADHGFRFLADKMWDDQAGGFFWATDPTGDRVLKPAKHLYGQATALYALCEYHRATGSQAALDLAGDLFAALEGARDPEYGGYFEFLDRDWNAPPPDLKPYVGDDASLKTMNTHLHLLEAITAYYRESGHAVARERLYELLAITTQAFVNTQFGSCHTVFRRDWRPWTHGALGRVSYGHDLEAIWLVIDANAACGVSSHPSLSLLERLYGSAVRRLSHPPLLEEAALEGVEPVADRRNKVWWVQAEGLLASLHLFHLTGDPFYLRRFDAVLRHLEGRQTDPAGGGWFARLNPDGVPEGEKAGPWKAGYHAGRALVECLDLMAVLPPPESRRIVE